MEWSARLPAPEVVEHLPGKSQGIKTRTFLSAYRTGVTKNGVGNLPSQPPKRFRIDHETRARGAARRSRKSVEPSTRPAAVQATFGQSTETSLKPDPGADIYAGRSALYCETPRLCRSTPKTPAADRPDYGK